MILKIWGGENGDDDFCHGARQRRKSEQKEGLAKLLSRGEFRFQSVDSRKDVAGASYFVIGSEKQMAASEAYLKSTQGADTRLYRLYPRDFWLVKN